MKKTKLFLILMLLCCASQVVNAQYGYGSRRGQRRSQIPPPRVNSQESITLNNPYDQVNVILPKCVEAFKLDDFEKEIIKGLLLKRFENQNVVFADKEISNEDKKMKLAKIDKSFYKDLELILSKEEIEEFNTMDFSETREERKLKKKKKKEKRKKG